MEEAMKIWGFSDCEYCGNKTKSLWTLIGLDKNRENYYYLGVIDYEYERIYPRNNINRPLSFRDEEYKSLFQGASDSLDAYTNLFYFENCEVCQGACIYDANTGMKIHPTTSNIKEPNKDMPINIKDLYNEASSVFELSPRSSLAIIRLALDLLCIELGAKENDNLFNKVEWLYNENVIDSELKELAHGVRGLGNGAVHPRNIDEEINKDDAIIVFELMNIIVQEKITKVNRKRDLVNRFKTPE
ncbi:DUF4145 domain-containing protein [Mammaliicoccus sciuri]|uniref:DUF4145 domain-containing protein n=1 Tax=Mammaliicoccus sciuri TaxID=1296 RepID=UPI003F543A4A